MRTTFLISLLLLFSCTQLISQTTTKWRVLSDFIPEKYSILDSASGDLDRDGHKDLVVILKHYDEDDAEECARILLVLKGNGIKWYQLMAQNDSAVLCKGCGGIFGDPYEGITIKNNYFSIEHYGGSNWRWTRIITFKYDLKTKQFLLHRDAGVSFHTSDPDKEEEIINNKEDFDKLPLAKYNWHKGF